MPSREPPDLHLQSGTSTRSVSSDAVSWEISFVDHLERFFAKQAWKLPKNVTVADYRRLMMSAFEQSLAASGATADEMIGLLTESIDRISIGRNSLAVADDTALFQDFALYSSPEFTERLEQRMRDVRAEIAREQVTEK